MTGVAIEDLGLHGFVTEFFKGKNGQSWGVTVPGNSGITGEYQVANQLLARMLERAAKDLTFALPYTRGDIDYWIVLGGEPSDLDRTTLRIERALVPGFALFSSEGGPAIRSEFDPNGITLHVLGAQQFPAGYYRFVSPSGVAERAKVYDRLMRWVKLEEERPLTQPEEIPNYASLTTRFHAATAAGNWEDSARVIADLDSFNLCSADNIRFLEIELLARQGRWGELWAVPDRDRIVRLRIPRAVRAALLTAFHESVLAPLELVDPASALSRYREMRTQLGVLIAGRFGLEQPGVLTVFGYEAVVAGAHTELESLIAVADEPTATVLRGLGAFLPTSKVVPAAMSDAEVRVRTAIGLGELEEALVGAEDIGEPVRRILARIEIASLSGDSPLAVEVLREVDDLSVADRVNLRVASPSLDAHLLRLAVTRTKPIEPQTDADAETLAGAKWLVTDWNDWFAAALANPTSAVAHRALERVDGTLERSFSDAWAGELGERVLEALVREDLSSRLATREAIDRLAQEVVADTGFPRSGAGATQLYGALFDGLIDGKSGSENHTLVVLALTDATLTRQPSIVTNVAPSLLTWFDRPFPALEPRALEAVELLIDYGAEGHQLTTAIRTWVTDMLDRPTKWDEIRISVWRRLVEWSHAGADLERRLADRLVTAAVDHDPVAALPDAYRIALFTLRPLSAERAKTLLLARNPRLNVDICDDKVLTTQAKHLARTADMPVIVTQCAKHALTEGIRDFLSHEPVYPSGIGSTGIVRAVVEAAGSGRAIF